MSYHRMSPIGLIGELLQMNSIAEELINLLIYVQVTFNYSFQLLISSDFK